MTSSSDSQATTPHWYSMTPSEVADSLSVDPDEGLDAAEVAPRRDRFGENTIATEPPPTVWTIALRQLADPMNLMLVAVAIASLAIGQRPLGIMVAGLVVLNCE